MGGLAGAPYLVMSGVGKWFGEFCAIYDIDLAIAKGERIVVCGPSGSGKSTMIRCINRLETYQAGEITLDGTLLDDSPGSALATRRKVGMVFQQFNLFPHLTVLETAARLTTSWLAMAAPMC